MKSGPAFLDLNETASWISTQLEKEGSTVSDRLVLRILGLETAFMEMVGLARTGDKNSAQAGYILRQRYWVVEPNARTGADWEVEGEGEEVQWR